MRRITGVALVLAGCASSASATPRWEDRPPPPNICNLSPAADCGAGKLPRLTERDWASGEFPKFRRASERGTVSVKWDGKEARVVSGCQMDGKYAEAAGEGSGGRFFGTNRVVFRTDEVSADCLPATHVVAAFVLGPPRFEAILVPLPCPPVASTGKATGCIGRGMTGAQRLKRAQELMEGVTQEGAAHHYGIARFVEVYALIPDDRLALDAAALVNGEDCALYEQFQWVAGQFEIRSRPDLTETIALRKGRPAAPVFDFTGVEPDCVRRPVFLKCFPGLFDPAPSGPGCWQLPNGRIR